MPLPSFPIFIDVLDPAKNGLYPSFSSQVKTETLAVIRDKNFAQAIVAMQSNASGSGGPWTAIDISAATVTVSIDNPDLFPTQGLFYVNDGSGTTSGLAENIGNQNLQNALNALANISAAGGLTCEIIGTDFVLTWNNNGPQSLLTSSTGSLYPASEITITRLQLGVTGAAGDGQPEIQSIQISQLPATLQNSFTITAGSPATMNGILSLATPGMLARFDSLPPTAQSFSAIYQVDIQFPGDIESTTILQIPVTVSRDVIKNGITALPPFTTGLTFNNGIEVLFGSVTALSSGAGTLSGLTTVGEVRTGGAVIFSVSGVSNGWFLRAGTDATSGGIQRPDDFNSSTNAVVWQQWM